jgi:DNA-binding winged helix-turn-helix (wHTH) protein
MAVTLHAVPRNGREFGNEREAVRYAFAGCELDVRARRLVTDGVVRHLERKTFELLVYLVSNRDRAVTKDELNRALWAGCAVSDGALTQCVWTARRAIGQEKGLRSLIQTLNGVGYRFVGAVAVTYEEAQSFTPVPAPVSVSAGSESLVVEALTQLARARLAAPGTPRLAGRDAEEDELLRAAIACRRFADSILGETTGTRYAGGMSRR